MSHIGQVGVQKKMRKAQRHASSVVMNHFYSMPAKHTELLRIQVEYTFSTYILPYSGDQRSGDQRSVQQVLSMSEKQSESSVRMKTVQYKEQPRNFKFTQRLCTHLELCKKYLKSNKENADVILNNSYVILHILYFIHLLNLKISKIQQLISLVVKSQSSTNEQSQLPARCTTKQDLCPPEPVLLTETECGLVDDHDNPQINVQNPVELVEKECDEKLEHEKALHGLHDGISMRQELYTYVVAQYPERHNSLLPIRLIERLEVMSPQEYRTYVIHDLSLEERESLMVDEAQRRKTFLAGWPHHLNNLSGIKMAQAGLYALGSEDRVQCAFCRGSLHQWESDDNPMAEHSRLFNFCRFVKGLSCGNIEYRSKNLSRDDFEHITRFGTIAPTTSEEDIIDIRLFGISTNRATEIRYAPNSARLRTFSRWPRMSPLASESLCDAGFYFTGFDDQVRCFYCAGGLREWAEGDDPWEEHARWFPNCSYLIHKKSEEYINDVHARTPAGKKCSRLTVSEHNTQTRSRARIASQELMKQCCMDLGHSADIIDEVIAANGGPFDDIGAMIDAIYAEEDIDNTHLTMQQPSLVGEHVSARESVEVSARQESRLPAIGRPEMPGGEICCKMCQAKTGNVVPATHIGLPCGHLIYCDACNDSEARKSLGQDYIIRCPARCEAILNGTMKVFVC